MTITELYPQLFGKTNLQDGNVIDMAEHGRVGGLSTGQGVKYVQVLDASGDVVDDFAGTGGTFNGLATITAIQGDAGTQAWRVTMATLPVVGSFSDPSVITDDNAFTPATSSVGMFGAFFDDVSPDEVNEGDGGAVRMSSRREMYIQIRDAAGNERGLNVDASGRITANAVQGGTWTVQPGNTPNTTAWLVTMATVSGRFTGWGGSVSAFQGGPWNVFSSLASGTNYISGGRYMPTLASLSSMAHREHNLDLFGNLMVNPNVPLPNSTRINRTYTLASMASLMASPGTGRRLVVRELDFSGSATVSVKLVEDQGGTPATIWGPHYFLPYAGITKTNCYIATTSNKSLGLDVSGTGLMGIDLRVETENV